MSWPIVGHDWAVSLLRQSLATDRVAHAYLFSGPPQIGKTTLARTLAQALTCSQPNPPCGECRSCLKVENATHPDVQVVTGEDAGSLKIDQVRTLQRDAVLRPYEGRYRVFILRRVDRATMEAADSLLKTLEEPPSHVVLLLTAVHADSLPATVVSRCQRLDLCPTTPQTVEAALRQREVAPEKAAFLARLAGGRLGWAIDASQDEALLRQRHQDLDRLVELLSSDRVERLEFAWLASSDSMAARRLIELWIGWWRDLLLLCAHVQAHVVNVDRLDELQTVAKESSVQQARGILRALYAAAAQLEANVNARLALESLLLKMPHLQGVAQGQV